MNSKNIFYIFKHYLPVMSLSGEDVEGSDSPLHNLLHPDAVGVRAGRAAA